MTRSNGEQPDTTNAFNWPAVGDAINVRFKPDAQTSDDNFYTMVTRREFTGVVTALEGTLANFGLQFQVDLAGPNVDSITLVSSARLQIA